MSNEIVTENIGDARVVRFTRPEVRNPLSVTVLDQIGEIVDRLESGSNVTRLIFTGTGEVFASGADLREIAGLAANASRDFALRGQALMARIADLPQSTVAAINGFCFGGALDLALACRRRIASPGAKFAHPGSSLGIITGWGGTQRLPRLIGQAKALEMFFTASPVSADEALTIGLIDELSSNPLETALISATD